MSQNIDAKALQSRIADKLGSQRVQVIDESAQHAGHAGSSGSLTGTHFRVRVDQSAFTCTSRVERHRLVYDAVQDYLAQGVHALAIEIVSDFNASVQ
jgi:BolA family transcriptional regulator, general stress-responsive regulator